MKKITISKLEQARRNPIAYQKSIENATPFGGKVSKFQNFDYAVRVYHNDDSINKAVIRLSNGFDNYSPGPNRNVKELYIRMLQNYANEYESLGFQFKEIGKRLAIPVLRNAIVSGNGPRVDFQDQKIIVCILTKEQYDWRSELKFPILQYFYSRVKFDQESEVQMGVYDIDRGIHDFHVYSENDVDEALKELKSIFRKI
jgi:hypothetical protein